MIRTSDEILADIDETLDQLIENANVIKTISSHTIYQTEIEALQKTQESLLARLVHMNDLLKPKNNENAKQEDPFDSIEKKILRFGRLNAQLIDRVSHRMKKSKQLKIRPHRKKYKKMSNPNT